MMTTCTKIEKNYQELQCIRTYGTNIIKAAAPCVH